MTLTEKVYTHLDMQVLVDAINKTLENEDSVTADTKSAQQKGHSPVPITEKCPIFLDIFVANVLQMRCELSKFHRFSPHLTTPQTLVKQGFERKSEFRRLSL